jgi:hypothetical protein
MFTVPAPWVVRSDKDTHFTTALATDAIDLETIGDAVETASNRVPTIRSAIRRITLIADQNLAWDVMLFRATFTPPLTTDADLHPLVEWIEFKAADGKRVAGAGLYLYTWTGLDIPYFNTDAPGRIHVGLVNRDAVAKNAGATGEVIVELSGVTA